MMTTTHMYPPKNCDTCDTKIVDVFYDAKTDFGPWANMCPSCFHVGPGLCKLGTGFGQEYRKQKDGSFTKTAG